MLASLTSFVSLEVLGMTTEWRPRPEGRMHLAALHLRRSIRPHGTTRQGAPEWRPRRLLLLRPLPLPRRDGAAAAGRRGGGATGRPGRSEWAGGAPATGPARPGHGAAAAAAAAGPRGGDGRERV